MKNRRVFSRILCVLLALSIVLQQADLSGFTGIFGGGTVVAEAAITATSYTVNEGSSITLTGSGFNGSGQERWTVESYTGSATITSSTTGNSPTATIRGDSVGLVVVTHSKGYNSNNSESIIIAVLESDGTDPGVGIYVYVAAEDSSGNTYSDEMLELLGIGQLDKNNYFPAGTITLPLAFFAGKTSMGALITSTDDYTNSIIPALKNIDTTGMKDQTIDKIDYYFTNNIDNNVANYAENIVQDTWQEMGSQCTALFSWTGESQGFDTSSSDKTFHLDVRFTTVTVTYKYGKNGITNGTATDNNTIVSKAFINHDLDHV